MPPIPESLVSNAIPMKWPTSKFEGESPGIEVVIAQELLIWLDNENPTDYVSDYDNIIVDLMRTWDEEIPSLNFFKYDLAPVPNKDYSNRLKYFDEPMGIYSSTEWFQDVSLNALAIAQFSGDYVNRGTSNEYILLDFSTIIINQAFDDLAWDINKSGYQIGYFDLPSIILHELGHFLGLIHETSGQNAVMRATIDTSTKYRNLYPADQNAISYIYGPDFLTLTAERSGPIVSAIAQPKDIDDTESDEENTRVKGFIELLKDGTCNHYVDGKLVYSH